MMRKNILFSVILFFNSIGLCASSAPQERVKAAIQTGDVSKVNAVLSEIVAQQKRGDVNFPDLLTYAIGTSTCEIVRALIRARRRGITIEDAIITTHIKDPDMLKFLVNQSDEDIETLRCFLNVAISKGWNSVVRFLIEGKKAPLFINELQKSAAHFTAEYGTYETMKLLLGLNPRLAVHPYSGNYTPLHDAAKYGKLKIVQLLVGTYSVAVNPVYKPAKRTPLHYAAREGHIDVVRYLVIAGACLDVKDINGWTPYEIARIGKKWAVEQFLKEELERRVLLARAVRPVYAACQAGALPSAGGVATRRGQRSGVGQNGATAPELSDESSESPSEQPSYPAFPELRLDVLGQKDSSTEHCQEDSSSSSFDDLPRSVLFFPGCWWQAGDVVKLEESLKRPRDECGESDDPADSSSISERVKRRHAKRQASK